MLFSKTFSRFIQKNICDSRCYNSNKNPITRTLDMIKNDLKRKKNIVYPEHADVVIIGGGFIGTSVGYWLKTRASSGLSVVILEKDLSYVNVQQNISHSAFTQHFSLPENIYLAQYTAEFFRNIKANLKSDIDINYCPNGYLILASEKYAERLEQNVAFLKEFGVKNELLTAADIKDKYPWINTSDITLGCISTESEGVFNPWALLKGLVMKCIDLEVNIVNAEVIGFNIEQQRDVLMEGVAPGKFKKINEVIYRTNDNEEHAIKFAACVLAAGDCSGEIAKLARIGIGSDLLKIPLPVERREYNIYSIQDEMMKASLNTPVIMDTSGLWLRRNGLESNFFCGYHPLTTNKPKELLDGNYFKNVILPSISNRYPIIKEQQVMKVTTEANDCNTFDESGILGTHPYHTNMYIAAGFGKLGCQHAPGIGRAIAESIIDGNYSSIDLTRFGFDRILLNEPLIESNMY
ncbi:FAD-dependent oxidoreductase domain-containing protein 1 [Battus philenor]|uniref:FAD-dependent oxidoreductase domain-containing protein 1 n=1 Tax=Battus philenor TaxID=42288 RepID=UPI0035CF3755